VSAVSAVATIPAATIVDYHIHSHVVISLSTLQSLSLIVGFLLIRVY
jgi:hypothetical protein